MYKSKYISLGDDRKGLFAFVLVSQHKSDKIYIMMDEGRIYYDT